MKKVGQSLLMISSLIRLIVGALTLLASLPLAHAEERMIDLPTGAHLYVETKGGGRPLLAVHGGLGLDHSYFQPWLDPLETSFQMIYPDLRGNGRSASVPDAEFTLDKMVDDLDALRVAMGIKQWAVLGHSYGGFVAQAYALKYPDAVTDLILANTSPAPAFIPQDASKLLLTAMMNPQIGEAFGMLGKIAAKTEPEGGDEQFKALWRVVLPAYFATPPSEASIADDKAVYREHAFVLGAQLTVGFDTRPSLSKLTMPALVLVGRRDAILPLNHSEMLSQLIPKAKLVVFDRSGHFPFIEERERFVAAVRAFLGK